MYELYNKLWFYAGKVRLCMNCTTNCGSMLVMCGCVRIVQQIVFYAGKVRLCMNCTTNCGFMLVMCGCVRIVLQIVVLCL